jgi:aminomethyltransferase
LDENLPVTNVVSNALKITPLHGIHQGLTARMMPFGGWDMPVQYIGITAEHQAVRTQAGMFDISHMGKFWLQGEKVLDTLQPLVPSDLNRLKPGQAKYTVLLNDQGGILDDLIVYYEGETQGQQSAIVIVNAATTTKDANWLRPALTHGAIAFEDWTSDRVLIAVQGPQAIAILQSMSSIDLSKIRNYRHGWGQISGQDCWFARTGYTGEDGFELMLAPEAGITIWQELQANGVQPCGLGARDTLRLEAAMALYGQDVDENTTPLEAGLDWLVHFDKGAFLGRAALLSQQTQGLTRQLVGLRMDGRAIARHDYPVIVNDQRVGTVTSGSVSPTLGGAIALAYVPPAYAQVGQQIGVEIRGKVNPAEIVARPFYRRPS